MCATHARSRRRSRGSDVVINLVGILFEIRPPELRGRCRASAPSAVALAAAAQNARMIHVSAIGADENSPAAYARSKAEGERRVLAATPDATIFRPSIVFGPNDAFFNRFAALARMSPVLPLIGGGRTRFQPVFAGDVAEAIAKAVDGETRPAASTNWAARKSSPFSELMEFVLATIERRRPAAAGAVRAGAAAGRFPGARAEAAADARSGRTAALRQCRVGGGAQRRPHAREGSASRRARSRRSCRPICGASARPASSTAARSADASGCARHGRQPRDARAKLTQAG